jgi:Fur family ferric uptake transcriptional regulator
MTMSPTGPTDEKRTRLDLRGRGYRVTPQRERILDLFQGLPEGTHLSAEDLYQRLAHEEPRISLATAYRTLKLLASLRLLREVEFAEGQKYYEAVRDEEPHQHLVCVSCGTTVEFPASELEAASRAKAAEFGFTLLDVQFKLSGRCRSCQSRHSDA